jgi:hypothetical protein
MAGKQDRVFYEATEWASERMMTEERKGKMHHVPPSPLIE